MKVYDVVLWNFLNWLPSYHLSVFTEMDSRVAFAELITFLCNAWETLIIDKNE
jgi:hypothetical protein